MQFSDPSPKKVSEARRRIPPKGEFHFRELKASPQPPMGTKRQGDPLGIPQSFLEYREMTEADYQDEVAARIARDEALASGRIEFIGMGRFRVKQPA